MVTISLKHHKARKKYYCSDCRKWKIQSGDIYLRLFGMCDLGDKPYEVMVCVDCAMESFDKEIKNYLLTNQVVFGPSPKPKGCKNGK